MAVPSLVNGYHDTPVMVRNGLQKNDSSGGWVVQKFGGTSVGKLPVQIAEAIVRASLKENKVVVVCSARSTGRKVEGTTSRLLEIFGILESIFALTDTGSTHYETLVQDYERLVQAICEDHINSAHTYVNDPSIRDRLVAEVRGECHEILDFRLAAERWRLEIDSRSKDRIVSFGEKMSARFLTALLIDRGVDAEYVDLSDIVHFKSPSGVLDLEFYKTLAQAMKDKLLMCEGRVPVLTGYFGPVPGGLLDGEIGRGYTDLCAALVAVGIKAKELQVWKEVDGIFTADPTKVPTAKLIPTITPAEAAELTFYGSEVIHHLTLQQVIFADPPIQIRIKNTLAPSGRGTVVLPDPVLSPAQPLQKSQHSGSSERKTPKRPTAVTVKSQISVINVHSNKRSTSHHFFALLFQIFHKHKISVDLIATSEVHLSLAVHGVSAPDLQSLKEDLEQCGEVSVINKMAILSLVGGDMKDMIGIAGKMFATLGEHNINIQSISQGASEINISCVIESFEATRAMNILHTALFTFLE